MKKDIVDRCEKVETVKKATSWLVFFGKIIVVALLFLAALFVDFFMVLYSVAEINVYAAFLSCLVWPLLLWQKDRRNSQIFCSMLLVFHVFFTLIFGLVSQWDNLG